uniref:Uncharacterized protein n=1 Tax=Octopus bimaculoides TaxID=37653 RepID=A0A0L8H594_OCTBM
MIMMMYILNSKPRGKNMGSVFVEQSWLNIAISTIGSMSSHLTEFPVGEFVGACDV